MLDGRLSPATFSAFNIDQITVTVLCLLNGQVVHSLFSFGQRVTCWLRYLEIILISLAFIFGISLIIPGACFLYNSY